MILLNQPYSVYERELQRHRRRQAARYGLKIFCHTAFWLGLGCVIGYVACRYHL